GPTHLQPKNPRINVVRVSDAAQMFTACRDLFHNSDITILSAAVADYKPKHVADQKIKKTGNSINLELEKTVDIAERLGQLKKAGQFTVEFTMKTENEMENTRKKK